MAKTDQADIPVAV